MYLTSEIYGVIFMTVGELITKYREEHHMSQRKFATKCGLSNGYVSMIEKNVNPQTGKPPEISPDAMKAIATAMDMTMDELARSVDHDTKIYFRVNHLEGLGGVSVSMKNAFRDSSDVDVDPAIDVLLEGVLKLSHDDRQKLLSMARVMFPDAFPD